MARSRRCGPCVAVSVARTAIGKALVSGAEEGWVTVDLDRREARAEDLLSDRNGDAADQIVDVLGALRAAPKKAVAAVVAEPDEEDDEPARILASDPFSKEPTDRVERSLATRNPSPPHPHAFRRPGYGGAVARLCLEG